MTWSVADRRAWHKAHPPTKAGNRERHLKHRHGITQAEYEAMLAAQDGHCFFCARTPAQEPYGILCVDHCHETKRIRGLVCRVHNHALWHFGDNEAGFLKALAYIRGTP